MSLKSLTNAYHEYVTTSVSVPILVSLDVGRRQAELEGCRLVDRAIRLAGLFRCAVTVSEVGNSERYPNLGRVFGVVPLEEMILPEDREDFGLDPTKVTLRIKQGLSGGDLKKALLDDYDVHFNKNTGNSILLMFSIGSNECDLVDLLDRMERYASGVKDGGSPPAPHAATIPKIVGFVGRDFAPSEIDAATARCEFHEPRFFSDAARQPGAIVRMSLNEAARLAEAGRPAVAAGYVTPYPPGFPLLMPGQLISQMAARCIIRTTIATREIHGAEIVGDDVYVYVFDPHGSYVMPSIFQSAR